LYDHPHSNFLQDHVSFTLILFVPLYWVLGWLFGTYTLMFIQTGIILIGGWFVYRLIDLKTGHRTLSLLALGQYLFVYGRWTMFDADCNLAIMASSAIPVLLYYFEKKAFLPMSLILAFILLTREDMPLWTLFIGLFMFITHFRDTSVRRASLLVMIVSAVYFLLIFSWIIPALETPVRQYNLFNYSALGKNPGEALVFMFAHPLRTISYFFVNTTGEAVYNPTKMEFYWVYLVCGGYLLFFRPVYLLMFLPILAKKMLNDLPLRWSVETYYSVEFVSLLPVAIFSILGTLRETKFRILLTWLVVAGSVGMTIYKLQPYGEKPFFWSDQKHGFYQKSFYNPGLKAGGIDKLLMQIPVDAPVSATGTITPHLAWRKSIYAFPKVEDARYLVLFTERSTYPLTQSEFDRVLFGYQQSGEWSTVVDEYPLLILERKAIQESAKAQYEPDSTVYFCDAESLSENGASFTSNSDLPFGNANTQTDDFARSGNHSIKLDMDKPFGFTTELSGIRAGEKIILYAWRKGKGNGGTMVAGAGRPAGYYNTGHQVAGSEAGWELIRKEVFVTQTWPGQKLRVYLWNTAKDPVYFDDFRIVRITP
jgi:uncharacterized membrane protein